MNFVELLFYLVHERLQKLLRVLLLAVVEKSAGQVLSELHETLHCLIRLSQTQVRKHIAQQNGNPEILLFSKIGATLVQFSLLMERLFELCLAEALSKVFQMPQNLYHRISGSQPTIKIRIAGVSSVLQAIFFCLVNCDIRPI